MPETVPATPAAPVIAPVAGNGSALPEISVLPPGSSYEGITRIDPRAQAAFLTAWGGEPVEFPADTPAVEPAPVEAKVAEPVADVVDAPVDTPAEKPVIVPVATPAEPVAAALSPEAEKLKKWEGLISQYEAEGFTDFNALNAAAEAERVKQEQATADATWRTTAITDLQAYQKTLAEKDPYLDETIKAELLAAREQQWLAQKAQQDLQRQQAELEGQILRSGQDEALRTLTTGEKPALPNITPRLEAALRQYKPKDIPVMSAIMGEYMEREIENRVAARIAVKQAQAKVVPPEGGRTESVVPQRTPANADEMSWQEALKPRARTYA